MRKWNSKICAKNPLAGNLKPKRALSFRGLRNCMSGIWSTWMSKVNLSKSGIFECLNSDSSESWDTGKLVLIVVGLFECSVATTSRVVKKF